MTHVEDSVYSIVMKKVEEQWDDEISFLQRIGRMPSTLGNENGIQNFLADYFTGEMNLEVDKFVPDVKELSSHPAYSTPEWSYEGRPVVVAQSKTKGTKLGKSVILQGHIDVVSPEPKSSWTYDPWGAVVVDDKMYGRGIQDMKSGVTAMIYALKAIQAANVELGADVTLQTVIEEECTGNGALAALERGYTADAALIPEPFGLQAVKAQVGVLWIRVTVKGLGAHTERASQAVNPIEKAYLMINSLHHYEEEINSRPKHPAFADHPHPLNVNVGTIHSGDWPSNVPTHCSFVVRVGFYPGQEPDDIKKEVKDWLMEDAEKDDWLKKEKPELTFFGFHAAGFATEDGGELYETLGRSHEAITNSSLEETIITATTDLRFFNVYYDIPATCYGPVGANMHGLDEWVDLKSVKDVTKVYARFLLDWCGIRK